MEAEKHSKGDEVTDDGASESVEEEDDEDSCDEETGSEEDEDDDDGDDDDEDEWESENEEEGVESDQSDGESEKCPVCLSKFKDKDVGTPESCDHDFCLMCIQEWSKNVNTCPVDRSVFHLILVRHKIGGEIFRRIPVSDRQMPDDEEEDPTYCEVCGRCDREDRLLLCDGCDLGYHMDCLDPPLRSVPVEEWFCVDCATDNHHELAEEVSEDEDVLHHLRSGTDPVPSLLRPRRRQVARTRVSERVIARISEIRGDRRYHRARLVIESSTEEEDMEGDVEEDELIGLGEIHPSMSAPRPKRTPKKRKTRKRRSTGKKKPSSGKKKTTKKKKVPTATLR